MIATIVDGSRTDVVSTPWEKPLRKIPSKGKMKIPVKPYINPTNALVKLAPVNFKTRRNK